MLATETSPVRIQLPALHEKQKLIAKSKARFKVIVCGRRFGKTILGVREVIKGAIEDPGVYYWIGPNYPEITNSRAWPILKELASQLNEVMPGIEIRESDRMAKFPNGSEIWIKSAVDPDSLRGGGPKGIVLDEYAQHREDLWIDILRPALMDHQGWAIFIGTPRGKNWAYRLFESAKVWQGWECWSMPTAITEDGTPQTPVIGTNNPMLKIEELELTRQQRGSDNTYAQEILAEFGASQYLVFPEVSPDIHEWRDKLPEFVGIYGGMDFGGDGIEAHKSTVVLAGRTVRDELIVFATFKQAGPNIAERQLNWCFEQDEKLKVLAKVSRTQYRQPIYRADKSQTNGIQHMRNMGLVVWNSKGGKDSVETGVEYMHQRFRTRMMVRSGGDGRTPRMSPTLYWYQHGEGAHFVRDDLMKYRYYEPKSEDEVQKKNPMKVDDDLIDALRYLVEGVEGIVIGNPQELYRGQIGRME